MERNNDNEHRLLKSKSIGNDIESNEYHASLESFLPPILFAAPPHSIQKPKAEEESEETNKVNQLKPDIEESRNSEHTPVTNHDFGVSLQPPIQFKNETKPEEEKEESQEKITPSLIFAAAPFDPGDNPDDKGSGAANSDGSGSNGENPVQRKEGDGGSNDGNNSNGVPGDIMGKMESTIGHNFSNVNIHTDSSKATDVGALAYTQGKDVHFAPGQFNPTSTSGQELLGHELTHVKQQAEGRVKPTTQAKNGMAVNDEKGLEKEADLMGAKAAQLKVAENNVSFDPCPACQKVMQKANTDRRPLQKSELRPNCASKMQPGSLSESISQRKVIQRDLPDSSGSESDRAEEETLLEEINSDSWSFFAGRFNDNFERLLPQLHQTGTGSTTTISADGNNFTVEQLQEMFSEAQRVLLARYFLDSILPQGLFNGSINGNASAQQRLIISAEMLREGTYRSGEDTESSGPLYRRGAEPGTGRVQAGSCGHWLRMVYEYAGASPDDGRLPFNRRSDYGYLENPDDHVSGDIESYQEHYSGDRDEARASMGTASPGGRQLERRRQRLRDLTPGDWVFIYNANGASNPSSYGQHSFIFIRWIRPLPEEDPAPNRMMRGKAECMDQRNPDRGGEITERWLGDRLNGRTYPVTRITRVSADTGPVASEEASAAESSEPIQEKADINSENNADSQSADKGINIIQKMESSFGTSFSDVKIHENSKSAEENNALAYTQGSDIHFAPGQFKPDTRSGQELIGHELTHVVQQRAGRVKPTTQLKSGIQVNNDLGLEKEADLMGIKAAQGTSEKDHGIKDYSNIISVNQLKRNVTQFASGGSESEIRKRIVKLAQGEIGKVRSKIDDGSGNKTGYERLLEYFKTSAPGVWPEEVIRSVKYQGPSFANNGGNTPESGDQGGAKFPHWCGIFAIWATKKAGKDVGDWVPGRGVLDAGKLGTTQDPKPGDIGYIDKPKQHHSVIKEVNGDTIISIDGNMEFGEVKEVTRPRTKYSGFFTAFGGQSIQFKKKEDNNELKGEIHNSNIQLKNNESSITQFNKKKKSKSAKENVKIQEPSSKLKRDGIITIENFRIKTYASSSNLINREFSKPKGLRPNSDKHIKNWKKEVRSAVETKVKNIIGGKSEPEDVLYRMKLKKEKNSGGDLVNYISNIVEWLTIPNFNSKGQLTRYTVEHKVDWQIAGKEVPAVDNIDNLLLLDQKTNSSLGSIIQKRISKKITDGIAKYNKENDTNFKPHQFEIRFKNLQPTEQINKGSIITKEDLKGAQSPISKKRLSIERFNLKKGYFFLTTNQNASNSFEIKFPKTSGGKTKVGGYELSIYFVEKNNNKELTGIEFEPLITSKGKKRIKVKKENIKKLNLEEYKSRSGKTQQFEYQVKDSELAQQFNNLFSFTGLSPISIDNSSRLWPLEINGKVLTNVPFLKNADIGFSLNNKIYSISASISKEQLKGKLPGPIQIQYGSLQITASSDSNFNIDGEIGFAIKNLGTGTLSAFANQSGWGLKGNFDLEKDSFNGNLKIGYSKKDKEDDGKWNIGGNLSLKKNAFKGIKSFSAGINYENDTISATSKAKLDIPYLDAAEISIKINKNGDFSFNGKTDLNKIPKLKSGEAEIDIKRKNGEWKVGFASDVAFDISIGKLTIEKAKLEYKDGIFDAKTKAKYGNKKDKLNGSFSIGFTNRKISKDGKPVEKETSNSLSFYGDGNLSVQITDNIKGDINVLIKPGGEDVLLDGDIKLGNDKKLLEELDETFTPLNIKQTIPIFSTGVTTVEVIFTAGVSAYAKVDPLTFKKSSIIKFKRMSLKTPENFAIDSHLEVESNVKAGVKASLGLDLAAGIAVLKGSVGIEGNLDFLAINAKANAGIDAGWSLNNGFEFKQFSLTAFLDSKLIASLDGKARVYIDLWLKEFTIWSYKKKLAEKVFELDVFGGGKYSIIIKTENGKPVLNADTLKESVQGLKDKINEDKVIELGKDTVHDKLGEKAAKQKAEKDKLKKFIEEIKEDIRISYGQCRSVEELYAWSFAGLRSNLVYDMLDYKEKAPKLMSNFDELYQLIEESEQHDYDVFSDYLFRNENLVDKDNIIEDFITYHPTLKDFQVTNLRALKKEQDDFSLVSYGGDEDDPSDNNFPQSSADNYTPIQQKSAENSTTKLKIDNNPVQNTSNTNLIDSNITIHQNSSQASSLNALAFTQGSDIHFAPGQFNPESQQGQELLGHELEHVKQQKEGRVSPTKQENGFNINDNHRLEKEADEAGKKYAAKQMKPAFDLNNHNSSTPDPIQKFENDEEVVFDKAGNWNASKILSKLGQHSRAHNDSESSRCAEASALAAYILEGPDGTIGYLEALLNVMKTTKSKSEMQKDSFATLKFYLKILKKKGKGENFAYRYFTEIQESIYDFYIQKKYDDPGDTGTPANEIPNILATKDKKNPLDFAPEKVGATASGKDMIGLSALMTKAGAMQNGEKMMVYIKFIQFKPSIKTRPADLTKIVTSTLLNKEAGGHYVMIYKDDGGKLNLYDSERSIIAPGLLAMLDNLLEKYVGNPDDPTDDHMASDYVIDKSNHLYQGKTMAEGRLKLWEQGTLVPTPNTFGYFMVNGILKPKKSPKAPTQKSTAIQKKENDGKEFNHQSLTQETTVIQKVKGSSELDAPMAERTAIDLNGRYEIMQRDGNNRSTIQINQAGYHIEGWYQRRRSYNTSHPQTIIRTRFSGDMLEDNESNVLFGYDSFDDDGDYLATGTINATVNAENEVVLTFVEGDWIKSYRKTTGSSRLSQEAIDNVPEQARALVNASENSPLDEQENAIIDETILGIRGRIRSYFGESAGILRDSKAAVLNNYVKGKLSFLSRDQKPLVINKIRGQLSRATYQPNNIERSFWDWLVVITASHASYTEYLQAYFGVNADGTMGENSPQHKYRWMFSTVGLSGDLGIGVAGYLGVFVIEKLEPDTWKSKYFTVMGSVSGGLSAGVNVGQTTTWNDFETPYPWVSTNFSGAYVFGGAGASAAAVVGPSYGEAGMVFYGDGTFPALAVSASGFAAVYGLQAGAEVSETAGRMWGGRDEAINDARERAATAGESNSETSYVTNSSLHFEIDDPSLTADGFEIMRRVTALNRAAFESSGSSLRIEGYASRTGSEDRNLLLSALRAENTHQYFKDLLGSAYKIRPENTYVVGYGENTAREAGDEDNTENANWRKVNVTLNGHLILTLNADGVAQQKIPSEQARAESEEAFVQKKENPVSINSQIPTSVSIHQNSNKAAELGALAYTQGSDIHFAPGQFKPNTYSGQELLGHELHHVKQQSEGKVKPTDTQNGMNINNDKTLEKEADKEGRKFADKSFKPFSLPQLNNSSSNIQKKTLLTNNDSSITQIEGISEAITSNSTFPTAQFKLTNEQKQLGDEANFLSSLSPFNINDDNENNKNLNVVQKFESPEHKLIGDLGSANTQIKLSPHITVSFGEITAMAGDFYGSVDEIKRLAKIKGDNGQKPNSCDEIEYVLAVEVRKTIKKKDASKKFSEAVIKSADNRANALLPGNWTHFTRTKESDALDEHNELNDKYDEKGNPLNNATSYASAHENAVELAYKLGKEGKPIDEAMLFEAFGSHFLTDAFASGHTRTPRYEISQFWNKKIPLFWLNAQWWMAEQLAHEINKTWRGVASTQYIFEQALDTIKDQVKKSGFPPLLLGDVISGALHDIDNEKGVKVSIEGGEHTLLGDGQILNNKGKQTKKGQETLDLASQAVATSQGDVEWAYQEGKKGIRTMPDVYDELLSDDGLFHAEEMWPQALPDADQTTKSISWKADSIESLIKKKGMENSLTHFFKEKAGQLENVAADLEDYKKKAMKDSVIHNMVTNSGKSLVQIVNYYPGIVSSFGATYTAGGQSDNNAHNYYKDAKEVKGGLRGLTVKQRKKLIHNVLSGATGNHEEKMIRDILMAMPASDLTKVLDYKTWRWIWTDVGGSYLNDIIHRVGPKYWRQQSFVLKDKEIKWHANGATSEDSEEMIIVILRTCTKAQIKKLTDKHSLNWNLDGKEQKQLDRLLK